LVLHSLRLITTLFQRHAANGYEEFTVNAANERLENFFIQRTFTQLYAAYEAEGIDVEYQPRFNSQRVVDMIMAKPHGMIPLLDDECKFPKGSDENFVQHAALNHSKKGIYLKAQHKDRQEFGVKHYAGSVWYGADGFLHKNRWLDSQVIHSLLRRSKDAAIQFMFPETYADRFVYVAASATNALAETLSSLKG